MLDSIEHGDFFFDVALPLERVEIRVDVQKFAMFVPKTAGNNA